MNNLQQREYYKIFTGSNQEEGYDKIHLGYEAQTTEIIFKKDQTTFFHMPYFSTPQAINDSSLVANGAIPGPIPAMADKIYKKLAGYGENTPWGDNSNQRDGTWLCSWLYALSSEQPIWLDRYYRPGRMAYKEALEGDANFDDYYKLDPLYYDIPSLLVLEPGVQYQYFHQGEKSIQETVKTFAGTDKSHLRLDINDWSCLCETGSTPTDSSIYDNNILIQNFKENWIFNSSDPGYIDSNSLSFDNTDYIDCKVVYDQDYNLTDEFTLSFWVKHNNWSNATSTQLVGNLRKSGYGIYYNNLYKNPYFAIPENFYGHLFYCNQEGDVYLDKNIQFILGTPADPVSVCINNLSEIVVLESNSKRIVKYNHKGDVLTLSKNITGGNVQLEGEPKIMILDGDNQSIVLTTSAEYLFDQDLILKSLDYNKGYKNNEQVTFNLEGDLIRQENCLDVKFDSYGQKWVIDNKGNVYCEGIYLENLPSNNLFLGSNTNLAIDPENNVWILAESSIVYKINPITKLILNQFEVGVQSGEKDIKNIGFIKNYNRSINKHIWYAVIYHNYEKNLYFVTLDGNIYKNIFLSDKLNIYDPSIAIQNKSVLQFKGSGDFTGYDQKRIFNKLKFNSNPQIDFKIGLKAGNRSFSESIHTLSIPVHYFVDNTWYLITATLKNGTMSLYVNNELRDSKILPSNYSLNYDFQKDLYIGTPGGETENLNREIISSSVIWNGYIDAIKIYDYAINPIFINRLVREKIKADDINWDIPTTALQYVEVIDRFFKHKMPGSKSMFFNIIIRGLQITDPSIKERIERDVKAVIESIKPAYTELLKVKWEN